MIDSPPSAIEERYHGALGEYFEATEGYFVRRYLPGAGSLMLDMGCGTGRFLPVFTDASLRVVGVDLLFADLQIAVAKNSNLGAQGLFICGDASRLPLPSRSVDFAVAMGIFQFMTDLGPFLAELARVTKPEGRIVFSLWSRDVPGLPRQLSIDAQQKTHHLVDVVAALAENGFEMVAVETTFYLLRRPFWWGYRLAKSIGLGGRYIDFTIRLESVLHKRFGQTKCGWQYLIAAQLRNLEWNQ